MPLTAVNDIAIIIFSEPGPSESCLTRTETANDCCIVRCRDDYRRSVCIRRYNRAGNRHDTPAGTDTSFRTFHSRRCCRDRCGKSENVADCSSVLAGRRSTQCTGRPDNPGSRRFDTRCRNDRRADYYPDRDDMDPGCRANSAR